MLISLGIPKFIFSRILADLYFDYRECLIHNRRQFNFPDRTQFVKRLRSERSSSSKGPSRWITPKEGDVHKWRHPLRGEGGSAKRWHYFISIFSKMGDKGEGRVKNLKKWVPSFMDGPLPIFNTLIYEFFFSPMVAKMQESINDITFFEIFNSSLPLVTHFTK